MEKMWAGRFAKSLDSKADDFNSSIRFDCKMYKQDIIGSMAHAEMLSKQGIISVADCEAILGGLSDILAELECITKVKVLPYHNYARSKYESLGKENTLPQVHIPTDEELETAVNILCSRGLRAESGRPLKKNNK